jgi:hypothetical protein
VIVVLGRPGLTADGRLDRPAGRIAMAASAERGRVELVGSVGDDPDGDLVAVELGRAGVGHAALLRDPAGVTPRRGPGESSAEGAPAENEAGTSAEVTPGGSAAADTERGPLPRLDAGDVDLGLHYLAEIQVLVVAEPLEPAVLRVVADAATYHRAALVLLAVADAQPTEDIPAGATILAMPAEDGGAFVELVGRYAALLDSGRAPAEAWQDAINAGGWEQAGD